MLRTSLVSIWVVVVTAAVGVSACGGDDDDDDTPRVDATAGSSDGAVGQPDGAPAQPDATPSTSCAGVCDACMSAMEASCLTCPTDPDCDQPGDACLAAQMIQGQFGCDACAGGLAMEAACDGT